MKATAQTFKAMLTGEEPKLAWTFLLVPAAVSAAFGQRGRVSVRGTINDFAFRSSILPDGKGGHAMRVNKAMQAGARAGQGDTVTVTIAPDAAPRKVATPPDVRAALATNAAAREWFAGLSPSSKKEFIDWITSAKRAETRAARVAKLIDRLVARKRRLDD